MMCLNESKPCFFVSDLHGSPERYEKLMDTMRDQPPSAVFMGGDLLPHDLAPVKIRNVPCRDFLQEFLVPRFSRLRDDLGSRYPRVFLILGNDDSRTWEEAFMEAEDLGIWEYAHNRRLALGPYQVFGYSHVPPTPFLLKDWEKYDVSRFVDPGSVSPEEGVRTVPVSRRKISHSSIRKDLEELAGDEELKDVVFLFHSPPYQSLLDRAALDGKKVDHVPLDLHVGSVAIQRFIESRQPRVTLHGHVHESSRITGAWKDRIGETHCFSAAYHTPELALVTFDLEAPEKARRLVL